MLRKTKTQSYIIGVLLTLFSSFQWAFGEPVRTVLDNGDSSNRVNIVVLGDGYTASEMQKYAKDVRKTIKGLFNEEPFAEYKNYFNVHRVNVTSQQSGADHPDIGVYKNTAFDATFNCNEIKRLICINTNKVREVLSRSVAPNQHDIVLVLVNDPQYGGSGGAFAVASTHQAAVDLVLHELGHSFGGLADEYVRGGLQCNAAVEPAAPNVTMQTNRDMIKWNAGGGPPTGWIDFSTPVPTTSAEPEVPGLYEGAHYCDRGLFRATYNSKMRTITAPFEQINEEQLIKRIYNRVSPIDASYPVGTDLLLEYDTNQSFSVAVPKPKTDNLVINWFVNDQLQETQQEFTLAVNELGFGVHEVKVEVVDPTSKVRHDPEGNLIALRTWNVTMVDEGAGCGNKLTIADVTVPARNKRKYRLIDDEISATSFWINEGDTWFALSLGKEHEIKCLRLAPRKDRNYTFDVYVDDNFVAQYTAESSTNVELQSFTLPPGIMGSVLHIESISHDWLKLHEVELWGEATLAKMPSIVDIRVPVKSFSKNNLHDNDLATFWKNDGNIATARFDLILDSPQEIKELRIAPRTQRAYKFNVYVDHDFVDQFTTKRTSTVALQTFALPADIHGSIVGVKSVSHPRFKIHEIELDHGSMARESCSKKLPIAKITVPAGEMRKKRLVDDNLSPTSFWTNKNDTWFELSLNGEHEINCLQLAPRVNRAYTFDVYVDDNFVAQYTTENTNSIALQNFTLPTGTRGSVIRVKSASQNWFKVHEVELLSDY